MIVVERQVISELIFGPGFKPEVLSIMERVGSSQEFKGSLARLLLKSPATAVYHLSADNQRFLGRREGEYPYVPPILLGVNYSGGAHSEGEHTVVVQDVGARRGQWVLYAPPGSGERTFYLQDVTFPHHRPAEFSEEVANSLKIRSRYYHTGDPLDIFTHFQEIGYEFIDHPIPEDRRYELQDFHYSQ